VFTIFNYFISVNEIIFIPGCINIHSSSSASTDQDSSKPANVNAGASDDVTSILRIKSLA
jgi:hypothetical protein